MNKRLVVLLAVLMLPEVVKASGTPTQPTYPCSISPTSRCKPAPPVPCGPQGKPCKPQPKQG